MGYVCDSLLCCGAAFAVKIYFGNFILWLCGRLLCMLLYNVITNMVKNMDLQIWKGKSR